MDASTPLLGLTEITFESIVDVKVIEHKDIDETKLLGYKYGLVARKEWFSDDVRIVMFKPNMLFSEYWAVTMGASGSGEIESLILGRIRGESFHSLVAGFMDGIGSKRIACISNVRVAKLINDAWKVELGQPLW